MKNRSTFLLVFSFLLFSNPLAQADDRIDFARQVLPILSNKCFVCHGPDTNDDTELRLDYASGAYTDLGGYKAVDQTNPEKSELLKRILSEDDPMPPEDFEKKLSADEKKILKDWIKQGGSYAKHWAYQVPRKAKPKSNPDANGSDVIDGFVVDKLSDKKLSLAKPAARSILARRTALTLIGLPPEPELLDSFMKDKSEAAFETFVDRLLEDRRYGEHQARYWLDAVRYGDTHGLHLDNRRGIFPYRDWVIRSFNETSRLISS